MEKLKKIYNSLPKSLQKTARFLYQQKTVRNIFFWRKQRWIKKVYSEFILDKKRELFMASAHFCNANRPINGYYMEFGCFKANTMRMAWDAFHYLFDWTYVGLDSFAGLPEPPAMDKMATFIKGKMKTSEEKFIKIMAWHGMPRNKLITVKGFYENSLTPELKNKLLPKKAAVIYVDCDYYDSTVPVLNFITDFLQKGTIIIFDDWNLYYGDPEKGERRAFKEFRERNPHLIFEEFYATYMGKAFVFLGEKQ